MARWEEEAGLISPDFVPVTNKLNVDILMIYTSLIVYPIIFFQFFTNIKNGTIHQFSSPTDEQLKNIRTGGKFKFVVREGDQVYNQQHYDALGEVR